MRIALLFVALVAVSGCGDSSVVDDSSGATSGGANGGAGTTGNTTGSGVTTGTTSSTGGAGAGGASTGGDGGGGTGGEGPPYPNETVRFVALGDAGEGNSTQSKVSGVVESVCTQAGGCDFALYLGDNFYDVGVDSASDPQFQSKFEEPYANLTFPFYVAMGNHDYGCFGAGCQLDKGQNQIDYATLNPTSKFKLPAKYYTLSTTGAKAGIDLFALDTNSMMFGQAGDQQTWLTGALATATGGWRIAFGHHTYVSNGQHGNAGEYEGLPFIPILNGENVKEFFDASVCNNFDIYFGGHDHNRQWLQPVCGVEFVVSGTAAKSTDLNPNGQPTFFEEDADGGFVFVEILGNELTGTFYDEDGNLEYTRTITK